MTDTVSIIDVAKQSVQDWDENVAHIIQPNGEVYQGKNSDGSFSQRLTFLAIEQDDIPPTITLAQTKVLADTQATQLAASNDEAIIADFLAPSDVSEPVVEDQPIETVKQETLTDSVES